MYARACSRGPCASIASPRAPANLPLTPRSRFLNTICTDVIHLHNKTLEYYKGDYDTFER